MSPNRPAPPPSNPTNRASHNEANHPSLASNAASTTPKLETESSTTRAAFLIGSAFFSPSSHAPNNLPASKPAKVVASFPQSTANFSGTNHPTKVTTDSTKVTTDSTKPFYYPKPKDKPNLNESSVVVGESPKKSHASGRFPDERLAQSFLKVGPKSNTPHTGSIDHTSPPATSNSPYTEATKKVFHDLRHELLINSGITENQLKNPKKTIQEIAQIADAIKAAGKLAEKILSEREKKLNP